MIRDGWSIARGALPFFLVGLVFAGIFALLISYVQQALRFEMVRTAPRFSLGPEGLGGPSTTHEQAFQAIMRQSNAAQTCRRLVIRGSPAGRLYGLLGLRGLKDPSFDSMLARCRASSDTVEVFLGCHHSRDPVSVIATSISRGGFLHNIDADLEHR